MNFDLTDEQQLLADEELAVNTVYTVEEGRTNPFLHLSMHLTITEQLSIDQPTGIRQAVELLAAKRSSMHEAQHAAMDCLGEMLWQSQRSGQPPDPHAYLDAVRRRATRRRRWNCSLVSKKASRWRTCFSNVLCSACRSAMAFSATALGTRPLA